MFNNVKIKERISWLGVNDRTTHLFESLWPIPHGVAYNTYLIDDEKTALMDTMKLGFGKDFQERVTETLGGRELDYLVVHHMEPDHAGEIKSIVKKYPNVKIVGNNKTFKVLESYFGKMDNLMEVKEGDVLDLGYHKLKFVFMPWVHWPEVMVSYDMTDGILFSADAFGTFGTLDGGIFDDEVLFDKYYEDDMRRYYSNIVGKYSSFVQKAFCKLAGVDIRMICPLHGPIWRTNVSKV
ncbi:MAG: FprA family A-type flavoprotein, partial [Rikenellaceae bacterium]